MDDINSLESESGIIASLIHKPELSFYSEQLLPNHFTKRDNQIVYQAICELAKKSISTIDPYNIIEVLNSCEATRRLADELSLDKLNELVEMSDVLARDSAEEYKILVGNVLDAAFRRDAIAKLRECQKICYDRSNTNVSKEIYTIIDDVMTEYSYADDIPELGEMVDDLWADVLTHQDGHGCGIPFKFPALNDFVTIEPGELVVLAAPMKGAKSMFMLNEAVDILKQGKTVMYIDSELSSRLFLVRLVSHLTGIEFARVRSGKYDEVERRKIDSVLSWIKEQKFVHLYMPIFDQQSIYTAVNKVSHRFGKLDVLIVDYLKSTGNTEAFATYQELGRLTDLIKNDIAGKMGIAALAAAQLNNANKLADSAKIARNASTIMLLLNKTPEEQEMDGQECGNKKLIVQLNRNGMQHADGDYIDINFDGNRIMLTEAKQHVPVDPF